MERGAEWMHRSSWARAEQWLSLEEDFAQRLHQHPSLTGVASSLAPGPISVLYQNVARLCITRLLANDHRPVNVKGFLLLVIDFSKKFGTIYFIFN